MSLTTSNAAKHLWGAILMSVFAIGCRPLSKTQPEQASSAALEVVMAGEPVRKTLILTTTQPARMESLEKTPIHSKLAAYVGEVFVDYGDHVEKNQPLAKLSSPEVDADVAQKQALLEQARAEVVQAEAGVKAGEAAVTTATAKSKETAAANLRAQADIERWRSEFSRIEQLAGSGAVNQKLVDETKLKLRAAEASLQESLATVEAAGAAVAQAEADSAKAVANVVAAKSRIQVAEANLTQAKATQSYLTLKAPFKGVVTLRQVDPGHLVQSAGGNSRPLFVVARTDKMRTFVQINEIEAAYVDVGDAVTVEVQSLRNSEYKGQITRTSVAVDPVNKSLETIIDIDNADGRLRPGLYATAKITLQEQKDVLTLPSAAVVRQGKECYCYRLVDGKASKTPIQVGIKVGDDFEVMNGLSAGDNTILNKAASLKDGQTVEILKTAVKK